MKTNPKEKTKLHPRNKHRARYNFKSLIGVCPELGSFVQLNIYKEESIDFSNPEAVIMLNKALLKHDYNIDSWSIPPKYLCPPIPGRADYIHSMADVLGGSNFGKIPKGHTIKCLDIGVGASCIYPIIGNASYGWSFIGSDIDAVSIASAKQIIDQNPSLKGKVELRLQSNPKDVFYGVITKDERIDLSICNPPFHASPAEAKSGALRKVRNLSGKKISQPILNFGGQNAELWCEGGERKFVRNMIRESKKFSAYCFWFSSLVSKQSNLKSIYEALDKAETLEIKTIPMGQGNKTSRIVAWTFLSRVQQKEWRHTRWEKIQ